MTLLRESMTALAWGAAAVTACTSFFMPRNVGHVLAGRTMDFGTEFGWSLRVQPRMASGTYAYLGIEGTILYNRPLNGYVSGVNEHGVTCDIQTLIGTTYQALVPPAKGANMTGVAMYTVCTWVLQNAKTAQEAIDFFTSPTTVVYGPGVLGRSGDYHYIIRDVSGAGFVLEYENGIPQVYATGNDINTSPGVVTNEPFYHWHAENIRLLRWKQQLRRPAIGLPGEYYPDARLERIFMLKQGLANVMKKGFQDAFSLTSSLLDAAHVPKGEQTGTDSGSAGSGSGEGVNSHTQFSLIIDLESPSIYWRTDKNPSYQGLKLSNFDIRVGAPVGTINMKRDDLPYYIDAKASVKFHNASRQILR